MSEPTSRVTNVLRRYAVAWTLLVGVAASMTAYSFVRSAVRRAATIEFERRTERVARALSREVTRHVELLEGLAGLHSASKDVTRSEFGLYAKRLLERHDAIRAFEWVPRVSPSERAALVDTARTDGVADFELRRFVDGKWVVPEEPWEGDSFPVLYVEPMVGNERALGIDLGSQASRREALEQARDTGLPTATSRIELVQDDETRSAFLVFVPVYEPGPIPGELANRRSGLQGFAVGVFLVREIARSALADAPLDGFSLAIDGDPIGHTTESKSRFRREVALPIAGREWPLEFAGFADPRTGLEWQAPATLFGGLFATLLLGGLVYSVAGRAGRVERLVEERTSELRSATQRLSEVFESAFDAIVVIGVDGRVRRWNAAAETIFGWSASEVVGELLEELVVPERYRAAHRAGLGRVAETGQSSLRGQRLELQALRRFGGEFPVELTITAVGEGEEIEFTAIVRDVSERVAHHRSLENVTRQLEHILNAIDEGVFGVDAEGRTTFVNRSAAEMLGETASRLVGRRVADLCGPGGGHCAPGISAILRTCEVGEPFRSESDLLCRSDGTTFPVSLSCTPIGAPGRPKGGAVVVFRDVSERERLLSDLRERSERLRVITDALPAFIAFVDADQRYRFVNAYYEKVFGVDREEIVGRSVRDLLGETYEQIRPTIESVLAGETIRVQRPVPLEEHDLHVDTTYVPATDDDGAVVGFHVMAVDVTERHRSGELARVLFEQSSDAHLIFDESGILECNHATVTMLRARDKADVLSRHPAEFSPEFQPDGRRSMEKSVEMDQTARDRGYHRFDWIHTRFDGEEFPCEVTLTPVVLSSGPALLVVWHDISERYAHEEEIERQRRETQLLLDNLPALVWYKSEEDVLLRVNRRVSEELGLPREEIEGRPSSDFYPNHHADRHRDDLEVLASGVPKRGIVAPLDSTNREVWLRTDRVPIADEEGRMSRILVVATDVTDLVVAERDLRRRTEERDRFFNGANDMLCVAGLDGYFKEVNTAFERTLGYSSDELLSRPFIEFVHPDDVEATMAAMGRLKEGGEVFDFRNRYCCKDGSLRLLSWSAGAPAEDGLLFAAARDITELQRTQEERDRFFNVALESMCICGMDGYFVRVNPALQYTLGYAEDELMSRPYLELIHEDDIEATRAAIARVAAGEEVVDFRHRCRRKDGEYRWLSWSATAANEADRFFAAGRDVTVSMEYERRLAEKSEELARSNQDLDQFAYVASHDLRSPLRGVTNLAEWIEEDIGEELSETSRNHLRLMRRQCRRMDGLLNGLLEYSRAGKKKYQIEEVDVGDVLAEVVALLELPRGFRVEWPSDTPTLLTERSPLVRVFLNIVGNAVKHNDRDDGLVRVVWRGDDDEVEFVVDDDGPGIEPSYRERVFEMFQTLRPKDEVESSGMGLAIVQRLVQHQGKTIRLETSPLGGCRFVFQWPKTATRIDTDEPIGARA